MNNWIAKYLLTAVVGAGALMDCSYCTALLATFLCVAVADYLGGLRARHQQAIAAATACRSMS